MNTKESKTVQISNMQVEHFTDGDVSITTDLRFKPPRHSASMRVDIEEARLSASGQPQQIGQILAVAKRPTGEGRLWRRESERWPVPPLNTGPMATLAQAARHLFPEYLVVDEAGKHIPAPVDEAGNSIPVSHERRSYAAFAFIAILFLTVGALLVYMH